MVVVVELVRIWGVGVEEEGVGAEGVDTCVRGREAGRRVEQG